MSLAVAILNCETHPGQYADWATKHRDTLESILLEALPHGSGIDADWTFDVTGTVARPVIKCHNSYHGMDENGYYCGWTDFSVVIGPSLDPINLCPDFKLVGRFSASVVHDLKGYLEDTISYALSEMWDRYHRYRLGI